MRNAPSQPHSGLRVSLLSATFRVDPAQKAFLKNGVQSLSRAQNQTTLSCCLSSGMDCRQLLTPSSNKTSVPKLLKASYLRTLRRSSSSCLRSSSMHLLASMYSCQGETRNVQMLALNATEGDLNSMCTGCCRTVTRLCILTSLHKCAAHNRTAVLFKRCE